MNKFTLAFALALTPLAGGLTAAPLTFDFKDPKGVNHVTFKLDAPLEAISGTANGVSGTVKFDPADPSAIDGKIVMASSSLHVPSDLMQQHMHGDQWMNVAKFPELSFEAKRLENVKTDGDTTTASLVGAFTAHGVTKELTVPIKLTYLKDKLATRSNGSLQGDLLVIRSDFTIKRSDFGISPAAPKEIVSDEVALSMSIAGAAPRT